MIETLLDFSGLEDISARFAALSGAENNQGGLREAKPVRGGRMC